MLNQLSEMPRRLVATSWPLAKLLGGVAMSLLLGTGCKPDGVAGSERYPDYVSKIMRRNCSINGCHTTESAEASAGLNLETWDDLFRGSRGGSPVVPYSPEQSFLLYAVNADTSLGSTLSPTMPIGRPALTRQQYADLRQWIAEGARNDRNKERFPPDAARHKWYVGNQGCDLVAVIDADSRQVMRYIQVGADPGQTELIHSIVMAPDQNSFYVIFTTFSPHIEQYSTLTDEKLANISLGQNGWNTMAITSDGKFGFVIAEYLREVATVDLQQQTVVAGPVTLPQNLHGSAVHPARSTLYVAMDQRSGVFALDYNAAGVLASPRPIDLVQSQPPTIAGELWPYQISFLPDGSKYFVLCWHSSEVRVLDGTSDALLDVIAVGAVPTQLAYSPATNRLFVACTEDQSLFPGDATKRGSVMVIDCQTHQVLKTIYAGFQPAGISVDEDHGVLVVVNRNQLQGGPAPHHGSTACIGRNGYITLIDLGTLELVPDYKLEVTVDPAAIAIKK
jgi:YVTN family beta-propeller protein